MHRTAMTHRRSFAARRIGFGVALLAAALLLGACSDDDAPQQPSSTSSPSVGGEGTSSSSTTWPVDEDKVPPAPTTEEDEQAVGDETDESVDAALTISVFWTRPHGQARPIDIPAYRDPEGGPYPLVVYGVVTNGSDEAYGGDVVQVGWHDASGAVAEVTSGRLVGADGRSLAGLAPGASADVIVVVDDQALASRLGDLAPSSVGPAT